MTEDLEKLMREAEEKLPEWIQESVRDAQQEMIDEGEIDKKDMELIHKVDSELKNNEITGIWGNVDYSIYVDDGSLEIDTFGVPLIPPEVNETELDISEKARKTFNDLLSDYGVMISSNVEDKFNEWLDEKR